MTKKIINLKTLHKDIKKRIKRLDLYFIRSYEALIDELAFLTYCVQKCEKIHNHIESMSADSPTKNKNDREDREHLKMKLESDLTDLKMQLDASEKN